MTPDVFLAASKRVVGNIRWRSKPNRHDSGWQFFFVALLDVAVGEVIPRASVRGNYRASVDQAMTLLSTAATVVPYTRSRDWVQRLAA